MTSDGVKTTPLSGQPDITGGTTPMFDAIAQAGIENGYREFVSRVAASRKMTPARVDEIGQGASGTAALRARSDWSTGSARCRTRSTRRPSAPSSIRQGACRVSGEEAGLPRDDRAGFRQ
ncbi:hypothetical protein [Sphingomonas sp. PAMC26645]|uniref:hypothetical protein n=1 Tax=Sphingomonas sp. PAMC26645 TaxID=2565555 RepID=UPI002490E90B|nr:hypothetical protein [Sphingomonas sp. PAMC26645]